MRFHNVSSLRAITTWLNSVVSCECLRKMGERRKELCVYTYTSDAVVCRLWTPIHTHTHCMQYVQFINDNCVSISWFTTVVTKKKIFNDFQSEGSNIQKIKSEKDYHDIGQILSSYAWITMPGYIAIYVCLCVTANEQSNKIVSVMNHFIDFMGEIEKNISTKLHYQRMRWK